MSRKAFLALILCIIAVIVYVIDHLNDKSCIEGDECILQCELSKSNFAVHWYKDDESIDNTDNNIVKTCEGRHHKLSIKSMSRVHEGQYQLRYGENIMTKASVRYIAVYVIDHLNDKSCIEGDECILQCELSKSNFAVHWYKDDESIDNTDNNIVKTCEGRHHKLSIKSMSRVHEGQYQLRYGENIMTKASVRYIAVYVIDHLNDISCTEGDECILQCQLSKSNFPVDWYKDDECIDNLNNIEKACEGRRHTLTIKSMSTVHEGQYHLKNRYRKNVMTKASVKCIAEMLVALKQLSEEEKKLYMSIIKSGTEVRRYIRILILGKNGVGKSCLLRRLLGEGIEEVKSTDGIDIVVRRCKINLSDGEWILDEVTDSKNNILSRIKCAEDGMTDVQKTSKPSEQSGSELVVPDYKTDKERTPNPTKQAENENSSKPTLMTSMTSLDTDKDEQLPNEADAHNQSTSSFVIQSSKPSQDIPEISNFTTEKVVEELADMLTGNMDKLSLDQCVECGFWDFAGEKDYYATHQIFLHSYALYVLVADMMSEDEKEINPDSYFDSIGDYMDFWFDNIHSHYVKTTEVDKLDPPVIVVGTGTDKCKDATKLEEKMNAFVSSAYKKGKKGQHLREICFVSNTEPAEGDFKKLRNAIYKHGQSLQTCSEKLPLRWIKLERSFDFMRKGGEDCKKNILSLKDVYNLSRICDIDDKKEINLFLKYQHKIGSIIYFETIPDYVILNPKWLANAFRCLISNKFDCSVTHVQQWRKLEENGELEDLLIEKLFEKAPELEFNKYQVHILNIMEAFDTIFKPAMSSYDRKQNMSSYYMPCMIKSSMSLDAVLKEFRVSTDKRTPWLCIEFDFMPLSFFNHILVRFIKKYCMCYKPGTDQPAIYHSMGVFCIDKEERIKLFVFFCKNTVAIQLWHWKQITKGTCEELLFDLQKLIEDLKKKYEAKQIAHTVKAKCADGKIQETAGRKSYQELRYSTDGKYMCNEHGEVHESKQMYQTWYEGYPEVDNFICTMSQKLDPKKSFVKNTVKTVQNLENADDVASRLFAFGLFSQEMMDTILEEKKKEEKNSKILETVLQNYRGKKAVKGLHDAILVTENQELAELLTEYVKDIEIDDNTFEDTKI